MNNEWLRLFNAGRYQEVLSEQVLFIDLSEDSVLSGIQAVSAHLQANQYSFSNQPFDNHLLDSSFSSTLEDGRWIKLTVRFEKITKIVLREPTHLKRIRLIVAYDGSPFAGFQRQSSLPSIQQTLEAALSTVHQQPIKVQGASRTDAGVHALRQVVHFDTMLSIDTSKWPMILNHLLPRSIRVQEASMVSPLFHSRYDVERKEYRYILNLGDFSPFKRFYEWTLPYPIDLDLLKEELKKIEGTHDFYSFCKGEKESTIRTIYETRCETEGQRVILTFIGNGFLHHMIRLIVASLVDIASHKKTIDMTEIILKKDRQLTKHLAPAEGLFLVNVTY